jgi:hypothetical protein
LIQFHIKVKDHAGKNDSHLNVCQTRNAVNQNVSPFDTSVISLTFVQCNSWDQS